MHCQTEPCACRKFLYDGKHNLQTRGLLVLLVSKAVSAAVQSHSDQPTEQMVSGIYPRCVMLLKKTIMHLISCLHYKENLHLMSAFVSE